MNVLDWTGPQFLGFYCILLGFSTALAFLFRWFLRGPSEVPSFVQSVDAYDAAYLAGGPRLAVDSAITALVQSGRIRIRLGSTFEAADQAISFSRDASLDQTVFRQIVASNATARHLHRSSPILTRKIAERLVASDLVASWSRALLVRLASAAVMLPALLISFEKMQIGMARHRPIEILLALWVITIMLVLLLLLRPVRRTRAAAHLLKRLRTANSALQTSAATASERMADSDIAMALALFGPRVLTGHLHPLRQLLWPPNTSGGHGCGSGSCGGGGGCGGGGCGGGGGGGGGGCGGCGGGGH